MNDTLFIVWTMVGTASLTLALVHGVIWLLDRRRLSDLAFCVVALSVAPIALVEYRMLQASTPAEYGHWLRLLHVPFFFLAAGLVLFVRQHFRTGRVWLAWTIVGMRAVTTVGNLAGGAGTTLQIVQLEQAKLFGTAASAAGSVVIQPLQWLATAASLLLVVYVLDATIALWRKGDRQSRRTALVVGGSIVVFRLLATVQSQLVVWSLVQMPVIVSPPFLVMLGAMTYELCRDIVRSAKMEQEARRLRDDLAHVARVSTVSGLSASLAHELNQPLGAILRNAEAAQILLERESPDLVELRAIVTDIRGDDQRAGAIIERMRALLRHEDLQLHRVALLPLAQDVIHLVRGDALARHVTIDCVMPEGLPAVAADRVQVSQVLLNLLVNGMDAVSASGNSARRVAIQARRADERTVEIAVADSGQGIAPEILSRLFEPFLTTKAKGLGIGLAVSRTIVEAHGGKMWAQNNPHSGATFRFTLPVAHA